MLVLKPFTEDHGWSMLFSQFPCAYGFSTRRLAYMLDSLVRVSRRVGWKPSASRSPGSSQDCTAPRTRADRRPARVNRPSGPPNTGAHSDFQTLPPQQFQVLFNSLFKVLFIFPSRYLFAIGLSPVFSLRWNLPPNWSSIPKELDSAKAPRGATVARPTGLSPSLVPHSRGLGPRPPQGQRSQDYNSEAAGAPDFQVGLFPVHSPLLGESWLVSFPPLSDMLKFGG